MILSQGGIEPGDAERARGPNSGARKEFQTRGIFGWIAEVSNPHYFLERVENYNFLYLVNFIVVWAGGDIFAVWLFFCDILFFPCQYFLLLCMFFNTHNLLEVRNAPQLHCTPHFGQYLDSETKCLHLI